MNKNKKISVLIADDSFFTRKILKEILSKDATIELIGEAKNGIEACEKAAALKPDVITLDYNLGDINGAEVISRILAKDPQYQPSILIISAYTKEGSDEHLECLNRGAIDIISKPSGEISFDLGLVAEEILSKIHMASLAKVRYFEVVKHSHEKKTDIRKLV